MISSSSIVVIIIMLRMIIITISMMMLLDGATLYYVTLQYRGYYILLYSIVQYRCLFCGGKREATHGQWQWPKQGGGELRGAYCAPGSPTDAYASCRHSPMAGTV